MHNLLALLDVGDTPGWGKEIGDAATGIGHSNFAVGAIILGSLFLAGKYIAKPYFDSLRRKDDK